MSTKEDKRKCEFINVTPAKAEEWLKKNTRNREPNEGRVERYTETMKQDEWLFTPEPIMFCDAWTDPDTKEEHGETLMEGQHRLLALVRSGKTVKFTVWFHCDPAEFMVLGQARARTQKDILGIIRKSLPHPNIVASICIAFMRNGLGYRGGVDTWMIRKILKALEPDVMAVVRYKLKLKGRLNREFTAAVMLAQLVDEKKTAFTIDQMKFGNAANKRDPSRHLDDYAFSRIMDQKRQRDPNDITFLKACSGFAAKLAGEECTSLKPDPAGLQWLRESAKSKLTPLLQDLLGRTPNGFYTPKPPVSSAAR